MKKLFSQILTRFVGEYFDVKKIAQELEMSLLKGKVSVKKVLLRRGCLKKFDLPVELAFGEVDSFNMDIPYASLKSKRIICELKGLNIVLRPRRLSNEKLGSNFFREYYIKAFEALQKEDSILEFVKENIGNVLKKFVGVAVNNIVVKVENIHIRYEDSNNRLVLGGFLNEFSMYNTDEEWKERFVLLSSTVFRKIALIKGFAVYFETEKTKLKYFSDSRLKIRDRMKEFFNKRDIDVYLIDPVDVVCQMTLQNLKPINLKKSLISVELFVEKLSVNVNNDQIEKFIRVLESVILYYKRKKFSKYKDSSLHHVSDKEMPLYVAGNWWKYILNSSRTIISSKFYSWKKITKRKSLSKRYKLLFKKSKGVKWLEASTEEEKEEFSKIESELSTSDIVYLRKLAYLEMEIEQEKYERVSKERGFWNSLFSFSSALVTLNEKEKRDLQKSLMEVLQQKSENDFISFDDYPDEYVLVDFKLHLTKLLVNVIEKGEQVLFQLVLDGLYPSMAIKKKNVSASLEVKDVELIDADEKKRVVVKNKNVEGNLLKLEGSYTPKEEKSVQLYLMIKNIDVILRIGFVQNVLRYVSKFESLIVELTHRLYGILGEGSVIETFKYATSILRVRLENRKRIGLKVEVKNPRIILPEGDTLQNSMVINVGNVKFWSTDETASEFVEKYELSVKGFGITIGDVGKRLELRREIVENTSLDFSVEVSITGKSLLVPWVHVKGSIEEFPVFIDEQVILKLNWLLINAVTFLQHPTGTQNKYFFGKELTVDFLNGSKELSRRKVIVRIDRNSSLVLCRKDQEVAIVPIQKSTVVKFISTQEGSSIVLKGGNESVTLRFLAGDKEYSLWKDKINELRLSSTFSIREIAEPVGKVLLNLDVVGKVQLLKVGFSVKKISIVCLNNQKKSLFKCVCNSVALNGLSRKFDHSVQLEVESLSVLDEINPYNMYLFHTKDKINLSLCYAWRMESRKFSRRGDVVVGVNVGSLLFFPSQCTLTALFRLIINLKSLKMPNVFSKPEYLCVKGKDVDLYTERNIIHICCEVESAEFELKELDTTIIRGTTGVFKILGDYSLKKASVDVIMNKVSISDQISLSKYKFMTVEEGTRLEYQYESRINTHKFVFGLSGMKFTYLNSFIVRILDYALFGPFMKLVKSNKAGVTGTIDTGIHTFSKVYSLFSGSFLIMECNLSDLTFEVPRKTYFSKARISGFANRITATRIFKKGEGIVEIVVNELSVRLPSTSILESVSLTAQYRDVSINEEKTKSIIFSLPEKVHVVLCSESFEMTLDILESNILSKQCRRTGKGRLEDEKRLQFFKRITGVINDKEIKKIISLIPLKLDLKVHIPGVSILLKEKIYNVMRMEILDVNINSVVEPSEFKVSASLDVGKIHFKDEREVRIYESQDLITTKGEKSIDLKCDFGFNGINVDLQIGEINFVLVYDLLVEVIKGYCLCSLKKLVKILKFQFDKVKYRNDITLSFSNCYLTSDVTRDISISFSGEKNIVVKGRGHLIQLNSARRYKVSDEVKRISFQNTLFEVDGVEGKDKCLKDYFELSDGQCVRALLSEGNYVEYVCTTDIKSVETLSVGDFKVDAKLSFDSVRLVFPGDRIRKFEVLYEVVVTKIHARYRKDEKRDEVFVSPKDLLISRYNVTKNSKGQKREEHILRVPQLDLLYNRRLMKFENNNYEFSNTIKVILGDTVRVKVSLGELNSLYNLYKIVKKEISEKDITWGSLEDILFSEEEDEEDDVSLEDEEEGEEEDLDEFMEVENESGSNMTRVSEIEQLRIDLDKNNFDVSVSFKKGNNILIFLVDKSKGFDLPLLRATIYSVGLKGSIGLFNNFHEVFADLTCFFEMHNYNDDNFMFESVIEKCGFCIDCKRIATSSLNSLVYENSIDVKLEKTFAKKGSFNFNVSPKLLSIIYDLKNFVYSVLYDLKSTEEEKKVLYTTSEYYWLFCNDTGKEIELIPDVGKKQILQVGAEKGIEFAKIGNLKLRVRVSDLGEFLLDTTSFKSKSKMYRIGQMDVVVQLLELEGRKLIKIGSIYEFVNDTDFDMKVLHNQKEFFSLKYGKRNGIICEDVSKLGGVENNISISLSINATYVLLNKVEKLSSLSYSFSDDRKTFFVVVTLEKTEFTTVFRVSPPLLVENNLSVPTKFALYCPVGEKITEKCIGACSRESFYVNSVSEKFFCEIGVCSKKMKQIVSLNASGGKGEKEVVELFDDSLSDKYYPIYLSLRYKETSLPLINVSLEAKYWIVDHTRLQLKFWEKKNKKQLQSFDMPDKSQLIYFSPKKKSRKKKIGVSLTKHSKTAQVSLDTIGKDSFFKLSSQTEDCEIVLQSKRCSFSGTIVGVFNARYKILNLTGDKIFVTQTGTKIYSSILHKETLNLYWKQDKRSFLIKIDGWNVSKEITPKRLNPLKCYYLKLRSEYSDTISQIVKPSGYIVRISSRVIGGSFIIAIERTEFKPFIINNLTQNKFEVDLKEDGVSFIVLPHSKREFCFESVIYKKASMDLVLLGREDARGNVATNLNIQNLFKKKRIRLTKKEKIDIETEIVGRTKSLTISPVRKMKRKKKRGILRDESLRFKLYVKNMFVSFIENVKNLPCEILLFHLKGYALEIKILPGSVFFSIVSEDLQVDDQSREEVTFPVVLVKKKKGDEPIMKFEVKFQRDKSRKSPFFGSLLVVEDFYYKLQKIVCRVDFFLFRRVIAYWKEYLSKIFKVLDDQEIVTTFNYKDIIEGKEPIMVIARGVTLYFHNFVFHGIKCQCSVAYTVESLKKSEGLGILDDLGGLFSNLDNVDITYNDVKDKDVFLRVGEFFMMIIKNYVAQSLVRFYKFVGYLDVIGNPWGLLKNVGGGFVGIFTEPFKKENKFNPIIGGVKFVQKNC